MSRKKSRTWWEKARRYIYSASGITTLLFTFYTGAKSHDYVSRLEDSMFYRNVPVAEGGFPDPAGLGVEIEINAQGKKESYFTHMPSGRRWAVGTNMLPKDLKVIENGLEEMLGVPLGSSMDRISMLASRVEHDNQKYSAEFSSCGQRIKSLKSNAKSKTREEICRNLISVLMDVQELTEERITQYDSYISELSEIFKQSNGFAAEDYKNLAASYIATRGWHVDYSHANRRQIERWTEKIKAYSNNQKI